ncbi:F-box/RNI-like/FBD-like domains-containing protein [Rhynchospora pubera]|uniref:F-box/RNI-like/FBD-like domains-containing protein n=1 Tax=Rhynchospora pubera TaxID=906938 RepID=A0AAV8EXN9_9POAL|nr:F-box/RNI-like/FBD-like domains-containing protein [Rhynchospora pubera]
MASDESERTRSRGDVDRLSSLPDPLLHHIMSFMPARRAVRLCVLSKRWKTLWTTMPVLNFIYSELWNNEVDRYALKKYAFMDWFAEIVSNMLFLRDCACHVHTFLLDCTESVPDTLSGMTIRPWIRYAIKHNLQVLNIHFTTNSNFHLPSELFTCPSLEDVTISGIGCITPPKIINLPSLRRLLLKMVGINQDFMSKLLCGCPVLEDLHVKGGSLKVSNITSQSLKHLTIIRACPKGPIELIDTRNLMSFHWTMHAFCLKKEFILNMPSLSEACIEFDFYPHKADDTKGSILCSLFHVTRLELKGPFTKECLKIEVPKCRTFTKLTCLYVHDLCLNCRFDLLSSLLEHCPNLKTLSLVHSSCLCKKKDKYRKQVKIQRFKCRHLETVVLKFSRKNKAFYQVVKCLQEAVVGLSVEVSTVRIKTTFHDIFDSDGFLDSDEILDSD